VGGKRGGEGDLCLPSKAKRGKKAPNIKRNRGGMPGRIGKNTVAGGEERGGKEKKKETKRGGGRRRKKKVEGKGEKGERGERKR